MKTLVIISIFFLGAIGCTPLPMKYEKSRFSEIDAENDYDIIIEYPEFTGKGADAVNEKILSGIREQVDKFKSMVADIQPFGKSTLEGNYNVKFNEFPFLSVQIGFEMTIPGTSVLLRDYSNINFLTTENKLFGSLKSFAKDQGAEADIKKIIEKTWRAGHEDLPCEITENTTFDHFTYDGRSFNFYVDLYSGNPVCQWQIISVEADLLGDFIHPDLKRLLFLERD